MSDSRSRAFLYGESVFTTLRVAQGKPFFAQAHKARLKQSSEWLWPGSGEDFEKLWAAALSKCPPGDGVWRLTLHQESARGQWRAHAAGLLLDQWWSDGSTTVETLRLRTCPTISRASDWPSFAKTSDYLPRMHAARAVACDEQPLFCVDDRICELMFANIVFMKDQTLITPLAGPNVLKGIGLQRLKYLADFKGLEWQERIVQRQELNDLTSAWAVNAVRGLIPVSSIDGQSTSAHPMGQQLAQEFFASDETN